MSGGLSGAAAREINRGERFFPAGVTYKPATYTSEIAGQSGRGSELRPRYGTRRLAAFKTPRAGKLAEKSPRTVNNPDGSRLGRQSPPPLAPRNSAPGTAVYYKLDGPATAGCLPPFFSAEYRGDLIKRGREVSRADLGNPIVPTDVSCRAEFRLFGGSK